MNEPIRLLVVDDNDAVADAFVCALAEHPGVKVVGVASDGADAVRMTLTDKPDVVLMDLRMPVMDGIRATRRIVAAGSSAKILMMTAYDDDSLVREATDAGAHGYLVKGTFISDVVAAITQVFQRQDRRSA
jgi:DNA-binding NarL/FixJ family response regulator